VREGTPEHFWSKVEKTETCWLWRGPHQKYGQVRLRRTPTIRTGAHRFSWQLAFGSIPEGQLVLHRCDTPLCVRPEHLFLGTHLDNVHDKIGKGRDSGPPAANRRKSHCLRGHPLAGDNLRVRDGIGRECRACGRATSAVRSRRRYYADVDASRRKSQAYKKARRERANAATESR